MAGLIRGNQVNVPGVTIGGGTDGTGAEFLGTVGPTGPTGPKGDTGDIGLQGTQGPQGSQGPQGLTGAQGLQGPQGSQGSQGPTGAAGRVILSGIATPPANSTGSDGDYYFNTSTRALYGPKASGSWPTTSTSLSGRILSGSGGPGSIASIDGDWYFDTTAKAMYGPKASGSWPAAVPLVANTLLNGTVQPLNTTGTDGDFYYNTTDKLFYGPKASNAWPAGASMRGPTGPAGPVSSSNNPSMFIQVAVSDETTPLTTGDKLTFRVAYAFTLTEIRASLTTAVSGSSLKIDVKKGGTSIFSSNSLLTIDDGNKTSVGSTAAYAISSGLDSIADDSEFTISVTQIGSATAGAGLKLTFKGNYAP